MHIQNESPAHVNLQEALEVLSSSGHKTFIVLTFVSQVGFIFAAELFQFEVGFYDALYP